MVSESVLPAGELARRCAEETARYRLGQSYDPRSCYELFRCALVQRNEQAWAAIYSQYHRLVQRWLGNAPEDADALVNEAFARFWHGLTPSRFVDFSTLDQILTYLKRCAQSTAIDAGRQRERARLVDAALAYLHQSAVPKGHDPAMQRALDEIDGERLCNHVMDCLDSSRERIVFRASFEWNLSPRLVAERWPDLFADAREVSRIKERIYRRLRRDRELRALLGMDD